MIPDALLTSVRGDACPTCGAHDGEPHGPRCVERAEALEAGDAPTITAAVALDFDGVINTAETYRSAERDALIFTASEEHSARLIERDLVARVQRVCDETGAGVVIVSAWRGFFPLDALTRLLRGAGLTAPVLGAVGGVKMSGDLRADALLGWLADRPEVTRWCVIDDGVDHYGYPHRDLGVRYHRPEFVGRCVHPDDGITDADADRAIAILGGPRRLAPAAYGPVNVDGDGREVPT